MSLLRTIITMVLSVAAVIALAIAGTAVADADGTPAPTPTPAFVASCPTGFTTADKSSPGGLNVLSTSRIDRFRVGRHDPCYDRLVIDVAGRVGGWQVRYVPEITSDPKGDVLTVPGQARLLIVVGNPVAHAAGFPQAGQALIPTKRFGTWVEFRSVIFAGSFENVTSIGLGVDEPRAFRVFALPPGPGHPHTGMLVVDVAQR